MTLRQIKWAEQHDWFLFSMGEPHTGMTAVCEDNYVLDGIVYRERIEFTSFAEMYAWAGY